MSSETKKETLPMTLKTYCNYSIMTTVRFYEDCWYLIHYMRFDTDEKIGIKVLSYNYKYKVTKYKPSDINIFNSASFSSDYDNIVIYVLDIIGSDNKDFIQKYINDGGRIDFIEKKISNITYSEFINEFHIPTFKPEYYHHCCAIAALLEKN